MPGDGLGKCGNCTDLICLRCIYAASIYADPSERAGIGLRARAQGSRDLEDFPVIRLALRKLQENYGTYPKVCTI